MPGALTVRYLTEGLLFYTTSDNSSEIVRLCHARRCQAVSMTRRISDSVGNLPSDFYSAVITNAQCTIEVA